jgi:hypothetical protein
VTIIRRQLVFANKKSRAVFAHVTPRSFWFTSWALWLLMSLAITLARLVYAVWVVSHVMLDIMLLSSMKTAYTIYRKLPL